MTLNINEKVQEKNPFEESFSTASSKLEKYTDQTMSLQDSYSTVSDQPIASEDSDEFYSQYQQSAPIMQPQYSINYQPQRQYNNQHPTPTKRNRHKRLSQDGEKRKNFLERNRIAALKCRQRKKQWLVNLQAQVEFLSNDNHQLQLESELLQKEITELKTLILAHKNCPQHMEALKTTINFSQPVLYHHSMHLNRTTTN